MYIPRCPIDDPTNNESSHFHSLRDGFVECHHDNIYILISDVYYVGVYMLI